MLRQPPGELPEARRDARNDGVCERLPEDNVAPKLCARRLHEHASEATTHASDRVKEAPLDRRL